MFAMRKTSSPLLLLTSFSLDEGTKFLDRFIAEDINIFGDNGISIDAFDLSNNPLSIQKEQGLEGSFSPFMTDSFKGLFFASFELCD